MIKANEIRIGNYYDHNGDVRKVTPSTIEEVWNAERQWCKPIPLTEEWLIRFGFEEYISPTDLRIKIASGVLLQLHFGVNQIECWIGDEILKTDIVYVHQLQNLYFALTQAELTLSNQ